MPLHRRDQCDEDELKNPVPWCPPLKADSLDQETSAAATRTRPARPWHRRTISRPPIQRWPTGSKCAEVFSSAIAGQVRPPFLPVECYGRFRSSYSPLTELRPISRSIRFCIGGWVENKLVNIPPPTSGCAINKCALEGDATMGTRFE